MKLVKVILAAALGALIVTGVMLGTVIGLFSLVKTYGFLAGLAITIFIVYFLIFLLAYFLK